MRRKRILILGIGNLLMGDEGVGVHLVKKLEKMDLPTGVECLDGGTGSFQLIREIMNSREVVLVDATIDGLPPGTIRKLTPRFSKEFPRSLTAHDLGLKDLLDAAYLLGTPPPITLFAVSIAPLQEVTTELTPQIEAILPDLKSRILKEVRQIRQEEWEESPVAASFL